MKKSFVFLSIFATLIACQKNEQSGNSETQNTSDSASASIPKTENIIISENSESKDSVSSIPEIEEQKEINSQNFKNSLKSVDSLSKSVAKIELKSVTDPEKDSTKKTPEKIIYVSASQPKVIKETKIIYKNKTQALSKNSKNLMQKNAAIEMSADDVIGAKQVLKYEIAKNDGSIQSENLQSNKDMHVLYLRVKVPLQKFDYFIDDLSSQNNLRIENKNIEVIGNNFAENTMCNIDLTIYNLNSDKTITSISNEDDSFLGKTFSAIASGWKVLQNIFLFLLPFWPIYLVAGFIYYQYKHKKSRPLKLSENE